MNKKSTAVLVILAVAFLVFVSVYLMKRNQTAQNGNNQVGAPSENSNDSTSQPNSNGSEDMIMVVVPEANQVVKSPLEVGGRARGNWYFEAVFPVRVVDENGNELGRGQAMAQGSWMTTDFVPFRGTITFNVGSAKSGKVIFENDNPSGRAENAHSVEIPVRF